MIYGNNFIWLHFPKCAGVTIEKLISKHFSQRQDIVFDDQDPSNVIWHHNLKQRLAYDSTFIVDGKDVICCFRRLPYWLLSRIHFEKSRSTNFVVTRDMFLKGYFFEKNGAMNNANNYAIKYSERVDHWIRVENLKTDFINTFSKFLDLSNIDIENEITKKRNLNKFNYIKDLNFYFSPDDLEKLYQNNEKWARLETKIYGDILKL